MRIYKVEIQGFKSFVHKEVLHISPKINVIVGPNGSGKSNIVDAISWVLGEQSVRSLRGERMEDIIFAGTTTARPVGMANVSLHVDNSDGRLPIEYGEVCISRRLFRSGESQFLLNKVPCRLKDIRELFIGTGSGKGALSLINQGQIDQVLNNKPAHRREVFEDASGISRFRLRSEEAHSLALGAMGDIMRLTEIVRTQEIGVGELGHEARKAQEYSQVIQERDRLQAALLTWEARKIFISLARTRVSMGEVNLLLEKLKEQLSLLEVKAERPKVEMEQLILACTEIERRRTNLDLEKGRLAEKLNAASERTGMLKREIDNSLSLIHKTSQSTGAVLKRINDEKRSLFNVIRSIGFADKDLESFKEKNAEIRLLILSEEDKLKRLQAALVEVLSRKADLTNRLKAAGKDLSLLEKEKAAGEKRLEALYGDISDLRVKVEKLDKSCEDLLAQKKRTESLLKGAEVHAAKIESQLRGIRVELGRQQEHLRETSGRLEFLEDMDKRHEGYSQGVKELFGRSHDITGLHGIVGDLFDVPPRFRVAVETALGTRINNVVTQTSQDARTAIELLKSKNAGRLTFLPLDILTPSKGWRGSSLPENVYKAVEVVSVHEEFQVVADFLLSRVFIAEDMDAALQLAKDTGYKYTVATLKGELIHPGGAISGGSLRRSAGTIIGRKKEIQRIREKRKLLQSRVNELTESSKLLEKQALTAHKEVKEAQSDLSRIVSRMQETKGSLTLSNGHLDRLLQEESVLSSELTQTAGRMKELQDLLSGLTKKEGESGRSVERINAAVAECETKLKQTRGLLDVEADRVAKLQTRAAELRQQRLFLEKNLSDMRSQLAEKIDGLREARADYDEKMKYLLEMQKHTAGVKRVLRQLNKSIALLLERHRELEGKQEELSRINSTYKSAIQSVFSRISSMESRSMELEKKNSRLSYEAELLKERSASLTEELQQFKSGITRIKGRQKESEKELAELQKRASELEPVRKSAIREFETSKQELQRMVGQLQDLKTAQAHLERVSGQLQRRMSRDFQTFFGRLKSSFHDVFTDLFGGGAAELSLEDASRPLETDINIKVAPPGKRMQALSLLSGGERALTALALLFAIVKERRSPFIILDEVDTSLDDVNLQRFTGFLKRYSEHTQFIIVSHRQATMEAADTLCGVTMPEDGVSKIVSVKLRQEVG